MEEETCKINQIIKNKIYKYKNCDESMMIPSYIPMEIYHGVDYFNFNQRENSNFSISLLLY